MSWRSPATYSWIVKWMPARGTAHTVVKRAWRGLIQVLTGPEPPPAWRWRSPQERQVAYAALRR
jgi:hypothetical protein